MSISTLSGGSGGGGGGSRLSRLLAFGQTATVGDALAGAVIGFILTVSGLFNALLRAVFGVVIKPLGTFGGGLAGLIGELFRGNILLLRQGAVTAVASIAPGATWAIGPLTFLFAVGEVMVVTLALAQLRQERETGNVSGFIPLDVPDWLPIGSDEEGPE